MTLQNLVVGQKAKIVKIVRGGAIQKRMADMGLTPGTEVEVRRVAPLGDPVEVRVRGYSLSLRKSELQGVLVETVA